MGGNPSDLVRVKDHKFRELGLQLADDAEADEVADLLCAHPAVMQRPVLVIGDRAVIARPAERVLACIIAADVHE